ncbi:MAG: c-type cytochrome, partial [Pyrinomonadaceae bacterium]
MADISETDKLVKAEPQGPAPDPITSRSTSSILLVCALMLTGVLIWALWDEVYGMRPWKGYQQTFVKRYERYLKRVQKKGFKSEKEVKASDDYQRLAAEAKSARDDVDPQLKEIDGQVKTIDSQLDAVTEEFQNKRGLITVRNYQVENAADSNKASMRKDVEELKLKKVAIKMPADDGSGKMQKQDLNFYELEAKYTDLKAKKAELLTRKGDLLKEPTELDKKRDEYVKDNVTEITQSQVSLLLNNKLKNFDYGLHQINVNESNIVDRCETCHLGIREPISITAADMMPANKRNKPDRLARAFVSHPGRELLQIHAPEKFGCASCHWGNGRATTDLAKGHGDNPFWLHPLFKKENMEAGCQQCHSNDRTLQGATTLNLGKDLFYERGCVGCHRYEGYDREADALSGARQQIKQLDDERTANERAANGARAESASAASDEEAQKLLARAESLTVTNSQLEAREDQLNTQARFLMLDQKKVGPNLKDVRLKLRKEWIPVWLKDPQAFRPGTKMPTFWYLSGEHNGVVPTEQQDTERNAIAAYLWQAAFEGQVPPQPRGDAGHGKELFETRGCLACHSIGEGEQKVGGEFAANLTRVGEKENYDYLVRWVHNPRERWAPYCPKEKRDLTPDDYKNHGQPYVFDVGHTQCPNDGAELQVQNMTVMPNFRLADADARDIATYLVSLSQEVSYPNASFMDDPKLKEQGRTLIKQYGCAGCHEIRGFEEEQRIGKELTNEGSTPLERLDFALMTQRAELGFDAYDEKKKTDEWYNHKGFFEHKISDPGIYDMGKEKDPKDHLRMPKPFLKPEWKTALTTFLMGSVGTEGANVPTSLFYAPANEQKDIQDGWWIVKKYNCMGCHNVQVGQRSILSGLPQYQEGGALGREQLPPGLMTEGARVDPEWLLRFLSDPSLTGTGTEGRSPNPHAAGANGAKENGGSVGQNSAQNSSDVMGALKPQPGENRNGVRTYLKVRMPTFSFSPNELRTLLRFFLAVSAQQEPYIKQELQPLTDDERDLARSLFTSQAAPCLKCHMIGDPAHDATATAPNFLQAGQRLKPDWTVRWMLDPQRIMPGTAMPSGLFKRDGERWVFASPLTGSLQQSAENYSGDHAKLLMRYLLQLTPDEQARAAHAVPT